MCSVKSITLSVQAVLLLLALQHSFAPVAAQNGWRRNDDRRRDNNRNNNNNNNNNNRVNTVCINGQCYTVSNNNNNNNNLVCSNGVCYGGSSSNSGSSSYNFSVNSCGAQSYVGSVAGSNANIYTVNGNSQFYVTSSGQIYTTYALSSGTYSFTVTRQGSYGSSTASVTVTINCGNNCVFGNCFNG